VLVLSRRIDETVIIGESIEVKVVEVRGKRVKLGVTCNKSIPIRRQEIPPRPQVPYPHLQANTRENCRAFP
jgi:carbon storage regulator